MTNRQHPIINNKEDLYAAFEEATKGLVFYSKKAKPLTKRHVFDAVVDEYGSIDNGHTLLDLYERLLEAKSGVGYIVVNEN